MRLRRFLLSILILCIYSCNSKTKLLNGDIIFQTDNTDYSAAIRLGTNSSYSHCGILFEENGQFYVYEAIQPVSKTPLEKFIARDKNGKYVVKRLREREKFVTVEVEEMMKLFFNRCEEKNYDVLYRWTDDEFYCSELVWKIYKNAAGIEIAPLKQLGSYNLESALVKDQLYLHFGDSVPYNEFVISPEDIFQSNLLFTIDSV